MSVEVSDVVVDLAPLIFWMMAFVGAFELLGVVFDFFDDLTTKSLEEERRRKIAADVKGWEDVRARMTSSGNLHVNRDDFYQSRAYKEQVEALGVLVERFKKDNTSYTDTI